MARNPNTPPPTPPAPPTVSAPSSPPPGVPAAPPVVDLAVDYDKQSDATKALAKSMYLAYIANSNGLAWDGRPCPNWDALGHPVRSHWAAASLEAMRSVLAHDKAALTEALDQLGKLRAAQVELHRQADELGAKLEAAGSSTADDSRAAKLATELKQCRDQLAVSQQSLAERDRMLKAGAITSEQRATKIAAERTAMLDVEVDKLRGEVARLEAELRTKS